MNWFRRLKWWVRRDEFVDELQSVLAALRVELAQRKQGVPGPGLVDELEWTIQELTQIEQCVATNTLPSPDKRWLSSSRMVTDTWPNDSQLGDRICELANLYRKLL